MAVEMVTNPKHYNHDLTLPEPIDVIRSRAFNLGTAYRYLARLGEKDTVERELSKTVWYLTDLLNVYYQRGKVPDPAGEWERQYLNNEPRTHRHLLTRTLRIRDEYSHKTPIGFWATIRSAFSPPREDEALMLELQLLIALIYRVYPNKIPHPRAIYKGTRAVSISIPIFIDLDKLATFLESYSLGSTDG